MTAAYLERVFLSGQRQCRSLGTLMSLQARHEDVLELDT